MHTNVEMDVSIANYELILRQFLHRRHRVLILSEPCEEGSLGWMMAQAVEHCGCVAVLPDGDFRWKNLLWLAFSARTETVIGSPQLILGLLKTAKATQTPLFVHDVLLCGNCKTWQREGILRGLDCRIWSLPEQVEMNNYTDNLHSELEDQLLSWSGILDFHAETTLYGNYLEVVTFPGEKIPPLPSCAKLNLRVWEPETDVPFSLKFQY